MRREEWLTGEGQVAALVGREGKERENREGKGKEGRKGEGKGKGRRKISPPRSFLEVGAYMQGSRLILGVVLVRCTRFPVGDL